MVIGLRHALFFMFASFVLGISAVLVPVAMGHRVPSPRSVVICEDGSQRRDDREASDPFYVATMTCNVGDANGPEVEVVLID